MLYSYLPILYTILKLCIVWNFVGGWVSDLHLYWWMWVKELWHNGYIAQDTIRYTDLPYCKWSLIWYNGKQIYHIVSDLILGTMGYTDLPYCDWSHIIYNWVNRSTILWVISYYIQSGTQTYHIVSDLIFDAMGYTDIPYCEWSHIRYKEVNISTILWVISYYIQLGKQIYHSVSDLYLIQSGKHTYQYVECDWQLSRCTVHQAVL